MSTLKEQLSLLKLKTKEKANASSLSALNSTGSNAFIKYKEVIKESLKQNKETPLYKKFKLDANEEKIIQIDDNSKNTNITITNPDPPLSQSSSKQEEQKPISQSLNASNNDHSQQLSIREPEPKPEPEDEEQEPEPEPLQKKEYKITIKPSEIIREIKEQDTTQRVIDVDKYPYDLKCNELYNWFHLTFIEWEKELEEILISDPELAKSRMGIYKQCRGYIKTLLIHLKEKSLTKVILDKLFQVMVFCIDGDYIRAHDNYIELSIGNAPWPMGVTMVGIHERSGRSKIYTSQVAYILNDDITKKYLQSVKRIMTFIQRRYPKSPSKCVFS